MIKTDVFVVSCRMQHKIDVISSTLVIEVFLDAPSVSQEGLKDNLM